ncbi:MAG: hypothetical protein V3574_04295 [Candidatus Moraniibacteriota bacterium]
MNIKLKFDYNINKMELYRGKHIVTAFDSDEFQDLIREIKRISEELSQKTKRKNELKAERKALIKQLKFMLAIKWIDFKRDVAKKIKKIVRKIKKLFKIK